MSVIAFHEKAGGSQGSSFVFLRVKVFLLAEQPLSPCFHAHSRGAIYSLGAGWAFSVQPVLPPDYRPVVQLTGSRTRAWRFTQSPELGFGLLSFLFLRNDFVFYAAAATVVGLLLCNGSYTSPLTHR